VDTFELVISFFLFKFADKILKMNNKSVVLITEGIRDIDIIKPILLAAKFPLDRINLIPAGGIANMTKLAKQYENSESLILLMDSDAPSVPDAQKKLQKQFSEKGIKVLFAISEVEAWIFADTKLLLKQNLSDNSKEIISRLSLPEEIPYPRQVAFNLFKNKTNWAFLENIDVDTATSRSPSLKVFLREIASVLNIDTRLIDNGMANTIDRKIFANLIKEVLYSDTIIYKTMEGTQFTAKEILSSVEEGGEVGKQYTSDLLRIARDFLKRQAIR
jgi:hypothetical protein